MTLLAGCSTAPPDEVSAVPNLEPALVTVERATIRSVVTLDAVALAGPTSVLEAPGSGTLRIVAIAGAPLVAGDAVAMIEDGDGTIALEAPASGLVASFISHDGAKVAEHDPVAEFAPDAFRFVASVPADLLYRLYDQPTEIVARIDRGPAPFACEFISLGTPVGATGNPLELPVELSCAVPGGVRVFSGVRATLGVTTGVSENALVVPLSAVLGEADRGVVTRVSAGGRHETVDVDLGLTDGRRVVILDGLSEGDQILDLPPDA